jgi:hypothetical protein
MIPCFFKSRKRWHPYSSLTPGKAHSKVRSIRNPRLDILGAFDGLPQWVFPGGLLDNPDRLWKSKHELLGLLRLLIGSRLSEEKVFQTPGCHSCFLADYYTAIDSGEAGIRDCADTIYNSLSIDYDGLPPVIEWPKITFVCHSLGGIVTRYMLERNFDSFAKTKVGLILIASPSYGSGCADILDWLLTQYRHRMGKQLQWGSELLDDLDHRFKEVVHNRMRANLAGAEFYEHHMPYYGAIRRWAKLVYPRLPPAIVSRDSASRYFANPTLIPGSDHVTICKPRDSNDRIHTELALFLRRHDLLPAPQAPGLEPLTRKETERSVDALRMLTEWLPANAARIPREVLGSLRDALSETRKYTMERSSGQDRRIRPRNSCRDYGSRPRPP